MSKLKQSIAVLRQIPEHIRDNYPLFVEFIKIYYQYLEQTQQQDLESLHDIDKVTENDKRAKLKIELVKLFVPRPLNNDEQKDKEIKSAIWEKLSGQTMNEEDDF